MSLGILMELLREGEPLFDFLVSGAPAINQRLEMMHFPAALAEDFGTTIQAEVCGRFIADHYKEETAWKEVTRKSVEYIARHIAVQVLFLSSSAVEIFVSKCVSVAEVRVSRRRATPTG